MTEQKDITIVYMVAGMSSRFGGKNKQFAVVGPNGETLIELSLNQAINAGFTKIIFIVGNKTGEAFKEKFGNEYLGVPIVYALQNYDSSERDRPWGTTDAVCSAIGVINSPFVICNGDDIYGQKTFEILIEHLRTKNTNATIGYELGTCLSKNGTVNRGIFKVKENYLESIQEVFNIEESNFNKKELKSESLCSMNIFALQPEVIKLLKTILDDFKKQNKGDRKIEALLPNDINYLVKKEDIRVEIYKTQDKWIGVTNPEDAELLKKQLMK